MAGTRDVVEVRERRRIEARGWHEYPITDGRQIPEAAGCYALYTEAGELVYIGQAGCVRKRIAQHRVRWSHSSRDEYRWSNIARMRLKVRVYGRYGEHAARELRLLKRLRPKWNLAKPGAKRRPGSSRKAFAGWNAVESFRRRPTVRAR